MWELQQNVDVWSVLAPREWWRCTHERAKTIPKRTHVDDVSTQHCLQNLRLKTNRTEYLWGCLMWHSISFRHLNICVCAIKICRYCLVNYMYYKLNIQMPRINLFYSFNKKLFISKNDWNLRRITYFLLTVSVTNCILIGRV